MIDRRSDAADLEVFGMDEKPGRLAKALPYLVAGPLVIGYSLTIWSIPWLVASPLLIGYELWAIFTSKPGGPLSQVIWWALGQRGGIRWWLLGWPLAGFLIWLAWHSLFEWPAWRELSILAGAGLLVGIVGLVYTALTG